MFDFSSLLSQGALTDLGKVISIDLMLAGDNVVILGALASRLPKDQRKKIIRTGVAISLVFLIGLSFIATTLLKITGVLLAGGLLLLWVSWKLYRELTHKDHAPDDDSTATDTDGTPSSTYRQMIWQVVIADLSMSLENVLAVAGAAREHPIVLFIGLAFSVTLMGVAATMIANLIERHRWVAYIGLAMILWVAYGMITQGWADVHRVVTSQA